MILWKEPLRYDIFKIFSVFWVQNWDCSTCRLNGKPKILFWNREIVNGYFWSESGPLRITNTTNNKSSKEGCVSLWNILESPGTKFVTELLGEPCLKSPEIWGPLWFCWSVQVGVGALLGLLGKFCKLGLSEISSLVYHNPTTWFQVLGIPTNFACPLHWSFWACRTVSKFKIPC